MKGKPFYRIALFGLLGFALVLPARQGIAQQKRGEGRRWTEAFGEEDCVFTSRGNHPYFVLVPAYFLIYEGLEGRDTIRLTVTVLPDTQVLGSVTTRVIEERETRNYALTEVSRNFFALCAGTNSLFYFGEDVDMYKDGKVISHEGSWRAYAGGAKPGIMLPGTILVGSRYYQEIAPGAAMDRAEILSDWERVRTPAGTFENCLKVEETTPLEPGHKEYKYYAPGIGLVRDGNLLLTCHGFITK